MIDEAVAKYLIGDGNDYRILEETVNREQYGVGFRLGNTELRDKVNNAMKEIAADKPMLVYIVAYFFYIDGVHTIISMSTSYGTNLGLDSAGMLLALLIMIPAIEYLMGCRSKVMLIALPVGMVAFVYLFFVVAMKLTLPAPIWA